VQGLNSAKEIWDVFKTAHEGDEVTKITKWEMIEGELGRFVLNKGKEPQAMDNRLKTMVNQVRNLGSTKWDDHEMVKVILRYLVFCGDPRYKLMSPEEVIGKFVSFECDGLHLGCRGGALLQVDNVFESSTTSKRHERKKYSKMPLRYPRISKRAPLLFVHLGKPLYFDGEDYCMWSDKMRHHLTSLHKRIWYIVEFGAQAPRVGDKDYDSDEAAQIWHFNSQATSILLASLYREEYNKVQGLKSTKEIWYVLKTAHEGDEVTKITKRETIEGELGRFILNKGEEPQAMYNRLKTMVNQVRNLGSTKWDDHEMVKVILRSLVFHGDPRYKLMSPEEVIGKFVSFELMIKDSKHIVNLEQGTTSTPEVQPVAFKATEEEKESASSRLPIDASKLDNEEMALIIKSFRQILKQRRGKDYKPRS
jgi:hypothetical protein